MENFLLFLFWVGVPAVLAVVGLWMGMTGHKYEVAGTIVGLVCGVFAFFIIISIPITRTTAISKCQEFNAVKKFCENRDIMTESERYALALKAVECNQWLASAQYWQKKRLLKIFWPEEIKDLKPIGEARGK